MKVHRFDADEGLIVFWATVRGPSGQARGEFVLDTGTTHTVLDRVLAEWIGLEIVEDVESATFTASGRTESESAVLESLTVLGREKVGLRVVILDLLRATGFDGLLGLDFLRGHRLVIDFVAGKVTLDEPPKRKPPRRRERN